MRKIYLIAVLILVGFNLQAQIVREDFNDPVYLDSFEDNKGSWPVMVSKDNFFIIQNGEYTVTRKNSNSEYALFGLLTPVVKNYKLETSIAFGEGSTENSYAGLMFLIQENVSGGYVVEITNNRKYRVRQLKGSNYTFLTGHQANEGWTKSNFLKEDKEYNQIELRVMKNSADIYFNSNYILSMSDPGYSAGKSGLIIGPASGIKVEYFNIYSKILKSETQKSSENNTSGEPSKEFNLIKHQIDSLRKEIETLKKTNLSPSSSQQEMGSALKALEKQLIEKNAENNQLKREIELLKVKKEEKPGPANIAELKNAIKILETQMGERSSELEALKKENEDLKNKTVNKGESELDQSNSIRMLENQLNTKSSEIEILKKEYETLKAQFRGNLSVQQQDLLNFVKVLEGQIRDLKIQNEEIKKENDQLKYPRR